MAGRSESQTRAQRLEAPPSRVSSEALLSFDNISVETNCGGVQRDRLD